MQQSAVYQPFTETLNLGDGKVRNFRRLGSISEPEDVWLGSVTIFGTDHHFQAIRVREDTVTGELVATCDPHNRLEDLYQVYDAKPQTVELPCLDGEFVILIHPHGD